MTRSFSPIRAFHGALLFFLAWLSLARGEKLSPLAKSPDWTGLDAFQATISREEFTHLLDGVYAPAGAAREVIAIGPDFVQILEDAEKQMWFTLRFSNGASRPIPRYWRPDARGRGKAPLAGINIAIDPGHLGGQWAKMEERWFVIGASQPVTEGDMTLLVSKILAPKLHALGANVSLVRNSSVPLTGDRPGNLRKAAIAELSGSGVAFTRENYGGIADPLKENSIKWHAEKLFYRVSEIRRRAWLINERIKPDLVLCLHFNAESWGDPLNPTLTEHNHLHALVNGCYSASELSFDDIRFQMLFKLLIRSYPEELAAAEAVTNALSKATGLAPYEYPGTNARRAGDTPFVWTRNLLANRIYQCPVVYLEPYVMNSRAVFDRVQAGDYLGEREIGGRIQKSIYREYADAVAEGLVEHFRVTPQP